MARKRFTAEQIIMKLREAQVGLASGQTVVQEDAMYGHPPWLGPGEQLRPEPGRQGGGASFAGLWIRGTTDCYPRLSSLG